MTPTDRLCSGSPARLRSARMTPARKPCMSNWMRPFFTFSVMMVLTEPSDSMHASWIFHLRFDTRRCEQLFE